MAELCMVCKKGYLIEDVFTRRNLIWKQVFRFVDCTNPKCQVHVAFERMNKNFGKDN